MRLAALLRREIAIAGRNKAAILIPLVFFVLVTSLFPFAVSPDADQLALLAPGVIWVAALLATLLSLEHFYQGDYLDGSLEQLLLTTGSPALLALAKSIGHWLLTGLPLVLVAPMLGLLLHLPLDAQVAMVLTLLLGTPALCLIGAIGMCLTLGINRNGILVSLLILPLYIPVLIFGSSGVQAASLGLPYDGQLALLAAIFILALVLAPVAAGHALKISTS